jgi:hypothetical protein
MAGLISVSSSLKSLRPPLFLSSPFFMEFTEAIGLGSSKPELIRFSSV